MRLIFTLLISVVLSSFVSGQTLLFSENFETATLPDSVNHVGTGVWGKSSVLASEGVRSDSLRIATVGDTVVMTTYSFSTSGNSFVMLYFDHICKIEFFDEAYIEVSNNNGSTWTRLTDTQYQSTGQFGNHGNKFTAAAYPLDWAAGSYAVPSNSWWKSEVFDISLLVGNAANVMIRFVLKDSSPGSSMPDNYAWFIDNIRVVGAYSELNPPILTMIPPIVQDTVYSTGPYLVKAHITDQSLIDTAYVVYWVNVGTPDTIGMNRLLADTFEAYIPFYGFGKNIHYYVVAIDGSAAHNSASSATYTFYCKFSTGGTFTVGTGTSSNTNTNFPAPYGNWFWGSKHQMVILASELTALGAPGGAIGSVAFDVATVNGVPLQNFTIKMGHTTQTAMVSTFVPNLTQVYTAPTFTEVTGWNTHTFQTPFVWNGVDNLVIETCFNNSSYTYNASTYYTPTAFTSVAYYYTDNATVCSSLNGTTSSNRPNMKIEILGVSSLTLDAGVGEIVYPTGGVVANSPFDVTVKVKNYGTDTLTNATINWRLNGLLQTPYSWTGTLLTDSLSPIITLGTLTLPVGVHEIVAWTDNPNGQPDLNTGNDSSKISFMACASLLSGTYTIGGTNPDFADFNAAIIALDQCGINGPVTFNVAPGTYNGQLTIPWISGSSATNTITFQAANNDSTSVIIQHTALNTAGNFVVKLDGAQHIILKNLKIAPGSNTYATAVVFADGANHNSILGCYLAGKSGTAEDQVIVRSFGATNGDNLIHGNYFESGYIGLYFKGVSSALRVSGITVENNQFEGFDYTAVRGEFVDDFTVKGNIISSSVINSGQKEGVHLYYGYNDLVVAKNKIDLSGGHNTNGINLEQCTATVSTQGLIANNFVSILNGANNTFAIRIQYSSWHQVYYNSIYVDGTSNTGTRGINPTSTSSNISVLNNNVESNFYPMLYEGSSVVRSNYNNYYSSSGLYGYYTTNYINFPTLDALKTATQKDTNSVSYLPYFTSTTDLHTFNGLLNGIATPVPEVTDDIDGEPRDPVNPDVGADEFTPSPYDAAVLTILAPLTGCGYTTTEDVTIRIKNAGSATINGGLTAHYQILGSPAIVTETVTDSIVAPNTLDYTFTSKANLYVDSLTKDSVFTIKAWVTLVGDIFAANDSVQTTFTSSFAPSPPLVADTTVPFGSIVQLSVQSPHTVLWFDSQTSTSEFNNGLTYTTPILYGNTTYWLEAWTSTQSAASFTPIGMQGGNSCGGGFMIDITALNDDITLNAFDLNLYTAGSQSVSVYYKSGTWVGNATNQALWTLNGSYTVVSPGQNQPTNLQISPITIPAGQTYSVYFMVPTAYSNISTNTTYSNSDMSVMSGMAHCTNWDGCCTPRGWNGTIYYTAGSLGCPSARVPLNVLVGNVPPLDLSVVTIHTPVTGFDLTASEPVTVTLANYGTQAINNFQVGYNINGGAPVIETITDTMQPGTSMLYTFLTTANLSAYQVYDIKAFAMLSGDSVPLNDTAYKTVENKMLIFCTSTATSTAYEDITNVTVNTMSNTSVAVGSMYSDFTQSVPPTVLAPGMTYPISISTDYPPGYSYPYSCWVKAWIDFDHDAVFDPVNEMIFSSATTSSNTVSGTFTVPATAVPGIQRLRVVMVETSSAASVNPCGTYTWGETEDYVVMIAPNIPYDAGVTTIIEPTATAFLTEGDTLPVTVTVKNFGTSPITALDVAYSINNGPAVVTSFTNLNLLQYDEDTLQLPDMICPPGNFTICAYTILQNDTNTFNDMTCKNLFGNPQVDLYTFEVASVADGCDLGIDTITVCFTHIGGTPVTGGITANYQVNGGAVVTEPLSISMNPNDSVCHTFNTLFNFAVTTTDSVFNIKAWVRHPNDGVFYNDTAHLAVTSMHTPAAPVAPTVTIPYGTQAVLSATSPTNDTILWYDVPVGGSFFHIGSTYTTGVLYSDTTLYVEAVGALPLQTFTVGAGTLQNSTTSYPTPYGNWYWGNKEQYLLLASELSTEGMVAGEISSLAFDVVTPNGVPLQNFEIKMGHTTLSSMTTSFVTSGLSTVYTSPTYTDVTGWNVHAFQNNFQWDGSSNLIVEVCFNNSGYTNNGVVRQTTTSHQSTTGYNSDNANVCSQTTSYGTFNRRPNIKFVAGANGCSSARVPLQVLVSGQQPCDVGVSTILEPVTQVNLGSQEDVKVRITNYGTVAQSNIPVSYKLDNLAPVTETYTGSIAPNSYYDYTFSTKANMSNVGNTYLIKSWTDLSCDSTLQNDTAWKSVTNLFPAYCISTATTAGYEDLTNVTLHTLNNTSAPVGSMYTNFTATVPPPFLSPGMTYPVSITSDFPPGYSYQYSCWVKVYIDLDRDGTLDPVNEMVFSSATTSSNTVTGSVTIPPTAMSGNTLMRVVLVETSSATSVSPCGTYSWGETEDYMVTITPQAACDAGIISVLEPAGTTPAGTSLPVRAVVMNFGSDPIAANTLSLAFEFNGGAPVVVQYPNSLPSMGVDTVVMPNITANMGNNTICVYTILPCDSVAFNNEVCRTVFGEFATNIPYFDDFETNNFWYKPDNFTNWQYGTPSASVINSAYSGTKAWVTNLTGNYGDNANEYIYTPRFDFSPLGVNDTVTLSFYHWCDMATNDYGHVQYSLDGGSSWSNLGFFGDPLGTNWYNTQSGGVHYFSLPNTGWMYSAIKLTPNTFNIHNDVQFRFHFYSNSSGNADGWAIDNFRLGLPPVPDDVGVTAINYPVNDTALGSQVTAVVTITNFGTNQQTSIPVALKINGSTVVSGTCTGTIPVNGTATYTFTTPFTVPQGQYVLCAETQLPGDPYTGNDATCKQFNPLPAIHDVGVVRIVEPLPDSSGNICFYHQQTQPWYQNNVIVRLRNFGQNTQTSIPLTYTFYNGGTVHTDTWTGTIATGDSVDFQLSTLFLPLNGSQQMCVETDLTGDVITTNNKACKSYTGVACIGIDDSNAEGFALYQNIPNPAKQTTVIGYRVPQGGDVTFGLVSMIGQVLHSEQHTVTAGQHHVELDVSSLAAGIYYYFIEFDGRKLTKKLVVNK